MPPLPLHYADYAAWQRSEAMAPVLAEELQWWQQTLSGIPQALDLPFDRPRPHAQLCRTPDYHTGTGPGPVAASGGVCRPS
ncbi:hypothetical protein [Flexibacterium corallicola]|uniref:hypothetical protein n=1 Tax=Flexibacterium corallicola TaxID=3037259 RepID=UPI00386213F6